MKVYRLFLYINIQYYEQNKIFHKLIINAFIYKPQKVIYKCTNFLVVYNNFPSIVLKSNKYLATSFN